MTGKRVNRTKIYIPLISLGLLKKEVLPLFRIQKTSPKKKHKFIKIEETRYKSPDISRMSRRTAVSSWVSARGGTTSLPCAAATSRPTTDAPPLRIPAAQCSGPGPPWPAAPSGRRWPNRRGAVSSWLGKWAKHGEKP